MLQPLRCRTWAPAGQTPVLDAWDRRDRLSAIAALSLSPKRQRTRLHFTVQDKNVRTENAVQFLHHLHRAVPGNITLVWDRYSVHRSAASRLQDAKWLHVEWLPPYAAELNPVEYLWSHTKYHELPNFVPDDKHHLDDALNEALCDSHDDRRLLRSFFHAAKLDPG